MTQKSLITILLDASSSMAGRAETAIAGINEYVSGVRSGGTDTRVSLVTFRSPSEKLGGHYNLGKIDSMQLDAVLVAEDIKTLRELTKGDMHCEGFTPLLQSIKSTIAEIERSLGNRRNVLPILLIQTDGQENSSVNVTNAEIKDLIAAKQREGWQFVFMGCDINAYGQGDHMGLSSDATISYKDDMASTVAAYAATAEITNSYLRGDSKTMAYSSAHKAQAGDVYAGGK